MWLRLLLLTFLSAMIRAQTPPLVSEPNTKTAADSVVTFNEIMYHPAGDDPELEWVEIYNQVSTRLDISGWKLTGGIEFQFPANTVFQPNSYLVISARPDRLQARTGLTNIFGPFAGRLSSSGETLRLRNQSGRMLDELSYTDEDPWPAGADGSGASLSKRGRYEASSPAANWRASSQSGGTPGRQNFEEGQPQPPMQFQFVTTSSNSRWSVAATGGPAPDWNSIVFDDSAWKPGSISLGYGSAAPTTTESTNIARGKTVITGSGAYSNNPFDVPDWAGNFIAQNVTDGSDTDNFGANYWLGREGQVRESFTLDLGESYPIEKIHLRNTHNAFYNDRGTAQFEVWASQNVDASKEMLNAIRILEGTLTDVSNMAPIPADVFTVNSVARYLKFVALTANNAGNNVGLNEIEVYAAQKPYTTDVQDEFFGKTGPLLVRIPFEVAPSVPLGKLTLRIRYADGFIAFLNGTEVARRNAPPAQNRSDADALIFETIDLSAHISRLVEGGNLLAIQAHNFTPTEPNFLIHAELTAEEAPFNAVTNIAFTEIAGASSDFFFVELKNYGGSPALLEGRRIRSSSGGMYALANTLNPNEHLAITGPELGFPIQDGDRLFLTGPRGDLIDAVEIHNRGRARQAVSPAAPWFYTASPTPGQNNAFAFHHEVVINEIMYHHAPRYRTPEAPFAENDEQWIELYNVSDRAIDLTAWSLDQAIRYSFPTGTTLQPNSYLVIANEAATLRTKFPGIAIIGNFEGKLSHHSDKIILRDAAGNPADEVRYHNSHPWPEYANGGGSTLELRDPRADNASPEAWGASKADSRSAWKRYTYRAKAILPVHTPPVNNFHEFRIGLLDKGEVLIDNITVTDFPDTGSPRQLLQNTSFTSGAAAWRLLGNHSHSHIQLRSDEPGNAALRLVATGNMSYLDNRLETTLKFGASYAPVVTGRDYEISFDAKWLAGSPQLRTELYYNKVAATTILQTPENLGTPGARNSIYVENLGPAYSGLSHTPAVPKPAENIRVSIQAEDADGVAVLLLHHSANGGSWRSVEMSLDSGRYTGIIPAQANGAVVQFYIEGVDSRGAVSTYPAGGHSSRALIKVDSTRTVANKQTFRIIMTEADSSLLHDGLNMMSDDLLGCTVVHNEAEVFYDAKIRLHGSMFSRNDATTVGLTVKFPADHRFRGSRESVVVRRRGMVENIVKHTLNSAGGLPGNYDDVVHLVSHRPDNLGSARLNLANYDDTYVDSNFEGDDKGTVFKLEGIRVYESTVDGSPEGLKLSQPIGWMQSYDIADLGNDPEQYRWGIMIQSDRARDDYAPIVAMGKAFSLTGTALKQAALETIDVDEWARLFALQTLLGITDIYGVENPHNFAFYARPSDGRVVGLQNDWEFAFNSGDNSIYGSKNVYRILGLPGIRRIYQGHILDLIDSVANSEYLTPWAQHYSSLTGESYGGIPGYVGSRASSARSQLAAQIPFEITTSSGESFTTNTSSITLEGRAWINVNKIYRTGDSRPLAVTWLDDQRWQLHVPLNFGTNRIELSARNYRGQEVATDSISVETTVSEFPQRDFLRITEIMYHPVEDDLEFIELINQGGAELSLIGAKFTAGIQFDFTTAAITNLGPFQRIVIVRNRSAFESRYGTNILVAGQYTGALDNRGEALRLVDASGAVIHEFAYDDSSPWPSAADGSGRSLEVINYSGSYRDPLNWRASAIPGGTPGSSRAPEFTAFKIEGDSIHLFFDAAPSTGYDIYSTDDLTSAIWTRVKTFVPSPQARPELFIDRPGTSARFYKILAY